MKQRLKVGWLIWSSLALSGCLLPHREVMPQTAIECTVLDDASHEPIAKAALYMVYQGPNGEIEKEGPFYADKNGHCRIQVGQRTIWMKGTDAYFAGGYIRHIEVNAPGYESTGYWENFDRGLLEKKSPFTFRLVPFRNRFGAVLVRAQAIQGTVQTLTLRVIDGPHAGEDVVLPVILSRSTAELVGKTLYLRQPLEQIQSDAVRIGVLAHSLEVILRFGFDSEPYNP